MEWKEIDNYEGLYQVSNTGLVRSMSKDGSAQELIMRPFVQDGYLRVTLRKDGVKRHFLVHQLVAKAFIPNPDNKRYVDHKDTNKQNNSVDNLHWVTKKENSNNPLTRQNNSDAKTRKRSLFKKGLRTKTNVTLLKRY